MRSLRFSSFSDASLTSSPVCLGAICCTSPLFIQQALATDAVPTKRSYPAVEAVLETLYPASPASEFLLLRSKRPRCQRGRNRSLSRDAKCLLIYLKASVTRIRAPRAPRLTFINRAIYLFVTARWEVGRRCDTVKNDVSSARLCGLVQLTEAGSRWQCLFSQRWCTARLFLSLKQGAC